MTHSHSGSPPGVRSRGARHGTTTTEIVVALSASLSILTALVIARLPEGRHLAAAFAGPHGGLWQPESWETLIERMRLAIHESVHGGSHPHDTGTVNWWADSLSADDARILATNTAAIFIRRANLLDAASSRWLGRSPATLVFDAVSELSGDAAAGLAGHRAGIRLDAVTHLDADAAKSLGQCRGSLSLDGLQRIDANVARGLAAHRGHLSLNGLTRLDPEAAEVLALHDGELCLNGLTSLSLPVAEALARHRQRLNLNSLESLDDDVAQALAGFRGLLLALDGVTNISDESAAALRKVRGCSLLRLPRERPAEGPRGTSRDEW